MGTPYRVYYIQPSLASSNMLVGREEKLYTHLRGAFSVARFDNLGNARAYESWNEHQGWLHVFYVYAKDRILTANMGAIGLNKSYEQTFIKVLLSSCSCNANIYKSICL